MPAATPALAWRPTNAPAASSRTDDIWFVDPSTGWAVNSNGQILMTSDGGTTWQEQFRSTAYLRCVGFASPLQGWVGTLSSSQRLYYTTDGGRTWALVGNLPPGAPSAICGLSVVNESVVYCSGTNFPDRPPRMMKTLDGGTTWTAWDMSEHATLLVDTFFTSPEEGWVVGGKADGPQPTRDDVRAVVLHTRDGGRTWIDRVAAIQDQLPRGEWGWKIQFISQAVGFISLENFVEGAILTTMDRGVTWTRKTVNDPQRNANLEGIGFVDERHGWVGGWGTEDFTGGFSSETLDGGTQWRNANEIGRFINRFRFFGNPVSVAYASGKTVFKYSSDSVAPPAAHLTQAVRVLDSHEPFEASGTVRIEYTVPAAARHVTIDIWDRFGDYVRKLRDDGLPAPGPHTATWDARRDSGDRVRPGIYIYRITIDATVASRIVRLR